MILFLLSLCALQTEATLHFVDLLTEEQSENLKIQAVLQQIPGDQSKPNIRSMAYSRLDRPLFQLLELLNALDKNRQFFFPKGLKRAFPVFHITFLLSSHDIHGQIIDSRNYQVVVKLLPLPGRAIFRSGKHRLEFNINSSLSSESQSQILRDLIFPKGLKTLPRPEEHPYFLDLYHSWPRVNPKLYDLKISSIFWRPALSLNPAIQRLTVHLGTTYCEEQNGKTTFFPSPYFHFLADSQQNKIAFTDSLKTEDLNRAVQLGSEFLFGFPCDADVIKQMVLLYLEHPDQLGLKKVIHKNQKIWTQLLPNSPELAQLENHLTQERRRLLKDKRLFTKNRTARIELPELKPYDILGGQTVVPYQVIGGNTLLELEVLVDDLLFDTLDTPYGVIKLSLPVFNLGLRLPKRRTMKLTAYFDNQTKVEKTVPIQVIQVDDQSSVTLMRVQAVVSRKSHEFTAKLRQKAFEVIEEGEKRPIQKFIKDEAPLRVAILLDTSISMVGSKLYHAQAAVHSFLERLEPADTASVYSFNEEVTRLSPFSNDYSRLLPLLYSVSPQMQTRLNDAILVAWQELMQQKGTRVLIIISDGEDNLSSVTNQQLIKVLRSSPVMVYSVMLEGKMEEQGHGFLQDLSVQTGSIAMRIPKINNLKDSFTKIYEELKSFYYLEFYSASSQPDIKKIKISINKRGHRVHFRRVE